MSGFAMLLPDELVEAIAQRAAELVLERLEQARPAEPASPYLTVPEAAVYIGARSRQRVDDLLSSGRLSRVKDGRRTLVARQELDDYLAGRPTGIASVLPPASRSRMAARSGR